MAGNDDPFMPRWAAAVFSSRMPLPSSRTMRSKWVTSELMTWSGWRSPPMSMRRTLSTAPATSPLSIESVSSHGGTEPATPRNGSRSSGLTVAEP